MSAFTCPRCLKKVDTIHTCTPTDLVRKLEQEIERLRHDIERHIAIASEHATECERLRAELAVARSELAVSVGHLSRLAQGYGCEDFTTAVDAALAAKGSE